MEVLGYLQQFPKKDFLWRKLNFKKLWLQCHGLSERKITFFKNSNWRKTGCKCDSLVLFFAPGQQRVMSFYRVLVAGRGQGIEKWFSVFILDPEVLSGIVHVPDIIKEEVVLGMRGRAGGGGASWTAATRVFTVLQFSINIKILKVCQDKKFDPCVLNIPQWWRTWRRAWGGSPLCSGPAWRTPSSRSDPC